MCLRIIAIIVFCCGKTLKNGVDPPKPRIDEFEDKPEPWQVAEILDPAQCRQATLPDITDISTKVYMLNSLHQKFVFCFFSHTKALCFLLLHGLYQVVRLLYTNSGDGILVLGFNGIQRLYKWVRNEQNPSGKVIVN